MRAVIGILLGISLTAYAFIFDPSPRIVGGQEAGIGQFKYQAALFGYDSLFCGGSWIDGSKSKVNILTAAHCVEDIRDNQIQNIRVGLGLHDKYDWNAPGVGIFNVFKIKMHPSYNPTTWDNDVAILVIDKPGNTVVSDSIEPISLASRAYQGGESATVSGWGTLRYLGSTPDVLHYVTDNILSFTDCKWGTKYDDNLIKESMMCCGSRGKDACQGDSGSPLVVTRNNQQEVVGVVSWGNGCGSAGYPGVYADVFKLRDWINANTE